MDKDSLLELREMIDNCDPETTELKLLIREVLEELLEEIETISVEDMIFALNVINLTPSIIYDRNEDSYIVTNDLSDNIVSIDNELTRFITFRIKPEDWFFDLREAFKNYIRSHL